MAKQVKYFYLVQGNHSLLVRVKTTTEEYFGKLIEDYRRLGKLDAGFVDVVPA